MPSQGRWPLAMGVLAALLGGAVWLGTAAIRHQASHPAPLLVYSSTGYGGFAPVPARPVPRVARRVPPQRTAPPQDAAPDAERETEAAYAAGRFPQVETAAIRVIQAAALHPTLPNRKAVAQARSLLAYAAARRHDLALARVRFAVAAQAAAALPDHGAQATALGQDPQPTLTEDATYQHAVCTAALGDKAGAEAEYRAFMRRFPESPLVMAALKRIGWMHGGDVPPADEAVWRQAMDTAQRDQKARARAASVCGPECLAELLRRRGEHVGVMTLASAMGTSDQGTTLASLAAEARRWGFAPQGLALTLAGLREQPLPVIALIAPGHYVLVDGVTPASVTSQGVTVWDPDAQGVGHPQLETVPATVWGQEWQGITLALGPAAPLRTAQR
jgi:hypothetical protein